MSKNRDDFTPTIKQNLQKRVGGLCSNPECKTLTYGPNEDNSKSTSIGIAAHITAAASNGPRYDESLTSEERSSINNGIWLCVTCSTIIDKDHIRFSVKLLKDWKKNAENYARDVIDGNAKHIPLVVLKVLENTINEYENNIEAKNLKIKELEEKYLSVTKSLEENPQASVLVEQSKEELEKGNFKKAQKLLLEDIKKKDKQNAQSYFDVAEIAMLQINYDEALIYYIKAVELDNENTKYLNTLGLIYNIKGNYNKSLEYNKKSLKINLDILGKNHIETAMNYNNIGHVYGSKAEYDKAINYYKKSLKISLTSLEGNHLETAVIYNNIGHVYDSKAEHDKALRFYKKSLKIRLDNLEENPTPDIAISYNNIGTIYTLKGEYKKAITYYKKSLKINLDTLIENHPSTAIYYNNIGYNYDLESKQDKAITYYKKSLKIRLDTLGKNHPDTAIPYNNIGSIYTSKGEYNKAIMYHKKSLKINLDSLGENHPSTAKYYNNIGLAYNLKCEYDKAIIYYEKSLKIRLDTLGGNHPDTVSSYNNLKSAYNSKSEHEKATIYYENNNK